MSQPRQKRGELSSPVVKSSVDTDTTDPVAPTIDQIDGKNPNEPTNNERPVIKVTSPEGRPSLVDEHGVDIPATIVDKGNGHYEITPTNSIKNKDVKVVATDDAGNKSNTTDLNAIIDTTAPSAPGSIRFVEDTNNDGRLNLVENDADSDQDNTRVEINLPTDALAGDKVNVKVESNGNTTTREITLTATDIANGKVTIDAPVSDATTTKATIKVVDQYGNESSAVTKTLTSKLSLPNAPTNIKFMEDTNNDNKLNKVENDADGDAAKTKVEIGIPTDANVGDTLEVKANGVTVKKVTLNAIDIATRKTVVEISVEQGNTTIKATVTDSSGNTSAETDKSIDIDTVAPTAPTITSVDGKAPTAPTKNNRPDIVVNSPDGAPKLVDDMGVEIPSTITDNGNGSYTINPNSALPDGSNINVVTTDDAGNKSETATVRSGIDTTPPSAPLSVKFVEDTNNNGEINITESKADGNITKTKVEITLPNNISSTDKLLVNVNGTEREITLTAAQISSKKVTLDVDITNETAMNIKAKIVDNAGNESSEAQKSVTPYIAKPDAPTNIEFPNTTDNVHDAIRTNNNNFDIKISLPTTAKAGDKVLLYQGSQSNATLHNLDDITLKSTITLTQADINNGYVTQRYRVIEDMHNLYIDYRTFKFYAKIQDSHGNESDNSNSVITYSDNRHAVDSTYTFTEDVNKDGIISKAENNSDGSLNKTSVEITFNKSSINTIAVGDKITLEPIINSTIDHTKKTTITVTQEMYDAGKTRVDNLTIHQGMINSHNKIGWNIKYETKEGRELTIADRAITEIEPDISAPTFTFTENTNNDAYINKVENQGDSKATTPIKITVDNTYNVGDKIEVKVNGTKTHTITVTSAIKSAGYTTADLTLPDSVKSTIEVSHSRAGVGQTTTKQITLDETLSSLSYMAPGLIGSTNTSTQNSIGAAARADGFSYIQEATRWYTATKVILPSYFNTDGRFNIDRYSSASQREIAERGIKDYFKSKGEEIRWGIVQKDMLDNTVGGTFHTPTTSKWLLKGNILYLEHRINHDTGSSKIKATVEIVDKAGNTKTHEVNYQANTVYTHLETGTLEMRYESGKTTSPVINLRFNPSNDLAYSNPIQHLVGWQIKFRGVTKTITEADARQGYVDLGTYDFRTHVPYSDYSLEIVDQFGNKSSKTMFPDVYMNYMKNRQNIIADTDNDNFITTTELTGNNTIIRVKTDAIMEVGKKIKVKNPVDENLNVDYTLTAADIARGYADINVQLREGLNRLETYYQNTKATYDMTTNSFYLHQKIIGNEVSHDLFARDNKTVDYSSYLSGPLRIFGYSNRVDDMSITGTSSTKDIFNPMTGNTNINMKYDHFTLRGIEMLDLGSSTATDPAYAIKNNKNYNLNANAEQLKEIWENLSPGANTFYIQGDSHDRVNLTGMRKTTEKLADPNGRGTGMYDVYTDVATGTIRVAVDEDINTQLYT